MASCSFLKNLLTYNGLTYVKWDIAFDSYVNLDSVIIKSVSYKPRFEEVVLVFSLHENELYTIGETVTSNRTEWLDLWFYSLDRPVNRQTFKGFNTNLADVQQRLSLYNLLDNTGFLRSQKHLDEINYLETDIPYTDNW